MRLDGKVREERENGMLSPVSKETPMECHGESAGIRTGAVVRNFGGNENIGLFMLSLSSWKTPMEYVTGSQRIKGRSCRKKRITEIRVISMKEEGKDNL